MKKLITAILLAATLSSAAPAHAMNMEGEKPSSTAIMFDLLLTRPLGLVATAVGTTVFIVGLPFTIPTGSVGLAAERLIADPLKFTFRRPVGEIDNTDYYNQT